MNELTVDVSQSPADERALTFSCPFLGCGKLRIWEGGGRLRIARGPDYCSICQSAVATTPADQALLKALIANDLT